MTSRLLAALATGAALLGSTAAQAETRWSIGINLPPADVYVSNAPRYHVAPPPVYYSPAPVVRYMPAPRYVQRDYYYAPPRVVYVKPRHAHHRHHHHHHHRWDRRDDDRRGHDGHGPYRGR